MAEHTAVGFCPDYFRARTGSMYSKETVGLGVQLSLAGLFIFYLAVQIIFMAKKPAPADEAEFRKSLTKVKKKLEGIRNRIRRRKNRNPLWEI